MYICSWCVHVHDFFVCEHTYFCTYCSWCAHIHAPMYICICVYPSLSLCICVYLSLSLCICVYLSLYTHMHSCTNICVCVYISLSLYDTHTYTHTAPTHICMTHIHTRAQHPPTHTHKKDGLGWVYLFVIKDTAAIAILRVGPQKNSKKSVP